jgi:hypothetical protein
MIPEFTDDGLPPEGVHQATLEEVKKRFGEGLRRKQLLRNLDTVLTQMRNCGVDRVYLGGSFVTDKPRPSDIDGCFDLTPKVDQKRMIPFLPVTAANRAMAKMIHKAEFFPSQMVERRSGAPFKEFFQRDLSGVRKGIVAIKVGR